MNFRFLRHSVFLLAAVILVTSCASLAFRGATQNAREGVACQPFQQGLEVTFAVRNPQFPETGREEFTWRFGDGTTGSGREVKHQYPAPGRYQACLDVTDRETGQVRRQVVCEPVDLTDRVTYIAIGGPDTAALGQTITLSSWRCQVPEAEVRQVRWLLDGKLLGEARYVQLALAEPGWHQVTLEVTTQHRQTGARQTFQTCKQLIAQPSNLAASR